MEKSIAILEPMPISQQVIEEFRSRFLFLEVKDQYDKEGYKKANEARLLVRKHRLAVQNVQKDRLKYLKGIYDENVNEVKGLAEPIVLQLKEIETHLSGVQSVVDDAKRREEEEKRAKRWEMLDSIETRLHPKLLDKMSDVDFDVFYNDSKEAFEAKKKLAELQPKEEVKTEPEAQEATKKTLNISVQLDSADSESKLSAIENLPDQVKTIIKENLNKLLVSVEFDPITGEIIRSMTNSNFDEIAF